MPTLEHEFRHIEYIEKKKEERYLFRERERGAVQRGTRVKKMYTKICPAPVAQEGNIQHCLTYTGQRINQFVCYFLGSTDNCK